jgi:hypothetical protein
MTDIVAANTMTDIVAANTMIDIVWYRSDDSIIDRVMVPSKTVTADVSINRHYIRS